MAMAKRVQESVITGPAAGVAGDIHGRPALSAATVPKPRPKTTLRKAKAKEAPGPGASRTPVPKGKPVPPPAPGKRGRVKDAHDRFANIGID
jgi:hypothetical protein